MSIRALALPLFLSVAALGACGNADEGYTPLDAMTAKSDLAPKGDLAPKSDLEAAKNDGGEAGDGGDRSDAGDEQIDAAVPDLRAPVDGSNKTD